MVTSKHSNKYYLPAPFLAPSLRASIIFEFLGINKANTIKNNKWRFTIFNCFYLNIVAALISYKRKKFGSKLHYQK